MDASGDQADEKQAAEKPIGIEEQSTIERQEEEAEAEEEGSTEDVNELPTTTTEEITGKAQEKEKEQSTANIKQNIKKKQKPVHRDQSTKLVDQFTKHFKISRVASDNTTSMLKQIQKQLAQIDKTTIANNKQQVVIRQLVVEVKAMRKQLDKIGSSVNRTKNTPNIKGKSASHKRGKK